MCCPHKRFEGSFLISPLSRRFEHTSLHVICHIGRCCSQSNTVGYLQRAKNRQENRRAGGWTFKFLVAIQVSKLASSPFLLFHPPCSRLPTRSFAITLRGIPPDVLSGSPFEGPRVQTISSMKAKDIFLTETHQL